jgi:peptide/nickel transport system permease protein
MYYNLPVTTVVGDRIWLTMMLSFATMIFSWMVSIPVGIYSATHQYTIPDYLITGFNFLGRGIPQFMLALVILWFAMSKLGFSIGGLFSPAYIAEPWSWAKFVDMLKHIWMPMLILAVGSTAGGIRITRANMLDELHKPYVTTARAKGLRENKLLWKYPVRVALNPFFSTVGWSLASLISGSTIVSIVLSLQTTGPMLFQALITQDMFLAGSFFLWLSALTVIGTLLSDILLAWVDPRIRLGQ